MVDKLYKSRKYGKITRDFGTMTAQYHGIVGYESDVANLVREIEAKATAQGLALSRWETSSTRSGWIKTITWAVHRGPRTDQSKNADAVASITLSQMEGTTKRCEAYRELSKLLAAF